MGRGPKPTKGKAKPAVSRQSPKSDDARVRDLEKRLADARERERATGEILQVISNSPADLQPVFDAIVRSAQRLLRAHTSSVFRRLGHEIHLAAYTRINEAADAAFASLFPMSFDDYRKRFPSAELNWVDGTVIQVPDFDRDTSSPANSNLARARGFRSLLQVPMRQAGHVIGLLRVTRREAGAFADDEITLLKTFADQAVIAIENVRLFTELQEKNHALTQAHAQVSEALEQQTATAEILRVISSSPTDVQPVFDAVAESAARLCEAQDASIFRREGDRLAFVAHHGPIAQRHGDISLPLVRGMVGGRSVIESRTVQVADLQNEDREFLPEAVENARRFGFRTILSVPLLREGIAIGGIQLRRAEVQLFSERQIALLQTFADQAVIAIENVRLFKELEERNRDLTTALDRQTATSEILRVLSSSPTDVQPVFDTIVESAARLCGADDVVLQRVDGDVLRVAAHVGSIPSDDGVVMPIIPELVVGQAILERRTMHMHDMAEEHARGNYPASVEYRRLIGYRTLLVIPLIRENVALGVIVMRRLQVRDFTETQLALLKTFADQAVIAIENVRLFKELEARNKDMTEALEKQTATSAILRVISQSPTDVQPVFDEIVRNAVRLCDGLFGSVYRFDGERIHSVAHYNFTQEQLAHYRRTWPRGLSDPGDPVTVIRTGSVLRIPNMEIHPGFLASPPEVRENLRWRGVRSAIGVPMLRQDQVIGAILVSHHGVDAFTDAHVELLKTFADQAVIAIENVRLFNETKEALERQTATAEILRVISSSPTDLLPVMEAVAENAARLCDSSDAQIFRLEGDVLRRVAYYGVVPVPALTEALAQPLTRGRATGRAVIDGRTIHVHDMAAEIDGEFPEAKPLQQATGQRTTLATPLLREGAAIGVILMRRLEVRPFSDKQIRLLETFADQAVIAIENVRLFTELQEKNEALTHAHAQVTEALDQQTATAEILRVISQSPSDVGPVFTAIAESAARLCDADDASIVRLNEDGVRLVAHHGPIAPPPFPDTPSPARRDTVFGRTILAREPIHVADLQAEREEFPVGSTAAREVGFRTMLGVPLLREGVAIGAIGIRRTLVQPFNDAQIALLQTFANQAVIAIENVRLFTELQASNRELTTALDTQTATSDILRVISRSQTDVQPVFDAILGSAVRLLHGYSSILTRVAGDQIVLAALTSTDDAGDAAVRASFPQPLRSAQLNAQAIRARTPLNIADTHIDPRMPEVGRAVAQARGNRSWVVVPMLHHDEAIGTIVLTRREPGGFTNDEIALLQTFADQAVIAIENARLLSELQTRTDELTRSVEQLTALGEVGRAVSSSLDLDTVLTTIVGRAVQLSGTDGGTIFEYDEGAEEFTARATLNADDVQSAAVRATRLRRGEGAVGQMAVTREPVQIPDIAAEGAYESRIRGAMLAAGTRSVLAIPLLHEERLVGGLVVTRRSPGEFGAEVVEILRTFATQSALAIQNARLFREIEEKSHQLEVASQHKSEFLANMSHELRTPLNAIIGFSEVLSERMFGELNEKQEEYLKDIHASGTHLLSLINDILDLSKIEAGRMELELTDFDLPQAIDDALILVRERAGRRGIALEHSVDERLGEIRGDERKVKQVLLNLLSNALKFTPEGGRVEVLARMIDGMAEVSVTDTGVGIASADQEAVFEEFRQAGTAEKKAEGTGLGLTLCRKFVELHGGRIWVKSQVGAGSTFTFTIPVRLGE